MLDNIHQALVHVRELKGKLLDSQFFRGYSGSARVCGGIIAILGSFVMSWPIFPKTSETAIWGWGAICVLAVLVNYLALLAWYLRLPIEMKTVQRLRPALDAVPPLFVAGVLTLAMIKSENTDLLFGLWMCLYGLMHVASRHSQPRDIFVLGLYYIFCGSLYLLYWEDHDFTNPWPMGIVFFVGEVIGGFIFGHTRQNYTINLSL